MLIGKIFLVNACKYRSDIFTFIKNLNAMLKTVEQHLQQCDKPWAEKALKNIESSDWKFDLVENLSDAINRGFSWSLSEEGHTFWYNIYFELVKEGK